MTMEITAGSTGNMVPIFVQDVSSTTGAGLGSLVYNSPGLAAKYRREGQSSWTAITLATATLGTFTSGGFIVDGNEVTGSYEFHPPNAACATGVRWVQFEIYGATNMLPVKFKAMLTVVDKQDGTRAGLTALPNAAAEASGGLVTLGTGAGQLSVSSGTVTVGTNNDKSGYSLSQAFPSNFSSLAITGGGAVTAGTVSDKTGYSLSQAFPSNFSAMSISPSGIVQSTLANGAHGGAAATLELAAMNVNSDFTVTGTTAFVGGWSLGAKPVAYFSDADVSTIGVVSKNGSALATASSVSTVSANVDTAVTQTTATSIRTAVGLGAANMDTQFAAIYTVAGDTKSQTDKLQFNGSNYVRSAPQTDPPGIAGIPAAVRDVAIASPASGSLGEGVKNAAAVVTSGTYGNAALLAAINTITGGGGGSLTVPVHVSDNHGADVVGKAVTVRLSGVVQEISAETDVDGNTSVSLNPGDGYQFIVPSGNGFSGSTTTVDIDDESTVELVVTAIAITPSSPGFSTGYLFAYVEGELTADVVHYRRLVAFANGETGISVEGEWVSAKSDINGLVQFTDHIPNAVYAIRRGSSEQFEYVAQSSNFQIIACA